MSIKNQITTAILSAAIATSTYAAPKVVGKITAIAPSAPAVVRIEGSASGMPGGLEAFMVAQHQGEKEVAKIRLQDMYMRGNYGIGAAYQHLQVGKSGDFTGRNDLGIIARMQDATGPSTGKVDLRYFPGRNELDYTAFLKHGKMYAESFGSYNLDTGKGAMTSGIFRDVKSGKRYSIAAGIEMKTVVMPGHISTDYVGAGMKVTVR